MKTLINRTEIPTAHWGEMSGYGWHPVQGCNRRNCKLGCWAAAYIKRFAARMAKKEYDFRMEHGFHGYQGDLLGARQPGSECNKTVCAEIILKHRFVNFMPQLLRSELYRQFPKKPSIILTGWRSDCGSWNCHWWQRIEHEIKSRGDDHLFMFLSKDPTVYDGLSLPGNCWFGHTITGWESWGRWRDERHRYSGTDKNHFLYIEPLQGPVSWYHELPMGEIKWVACGPGSRPEKNKPFAIEWVRYIKDRCEDQGIPFWYKDGPIDGVIHEEYPVELVSRHLKAVRERKLKEVSDGK